MLKYIAETINKNLINLKNPTEVSINKSLDAPGDDLTVSFALEEKVVELKNITVYDENNEKIFFGPIDIQKFTYKTSGSYLSLTARSSVSFLLDNEALPQTYTLPSLDIIFKRHIEPYGFTSYIGSSKSFSKEFVVTKGMSEWEVLETFCANYLGVYPKFLSSGVLDATGKSNKNIVIFSNNEDKGIRYSYISENIKRYKQYSNLYIKAGEDTSYSLNVKNNYAICKGILRKRYLNISDSSVTPIAYGEKILNSLNKSAYEILVSCPGELSLNIGDIAKVKDDAFKELEEDFLVYKIKYTLNKSGEKTDVTLIKKDETI